MDIVTWNVNDTVEALYPASNDFESDYFEARIVQVGEISYKVAWAEPEGGPEESVVEQSHVREFVPPSGDDAAMAEPPAKLSKEETKTLSEGPRLVRSALPRAAAVAQSPDTAPGALQPVSAKQLQLAAAVETVRAASPAMGDVEVIQRAREKVGGSKPSAEHIAMAADDQKRFQSEEAVWKAKIGKRSPCVP